MLSCGNHVSIYLDKQLYVSHVEVHDHSFIINYWFSHQRIFIWVYSGRQFNIATFIYFVTVDWLKYEWVKLLFHAVPFMPYLRGSDSTIVLYVFPQYTIHKQWSQWLCTRVILYTHTAACQLDDCPSVTQSVLCQPHSQLIGQPVTQSICWLVSWQSMSVSSKSVT